MFLKFAWRYFRAKKSANAINIIAWVTTCVIGFATCCQVLVLSVYNGFEDLVKSLYSSFYTDLRIEPASGKVIQLSAADIQAIKNTTGIAAQSLIAEDKAILQGVAGQTYVNIKGVDEQYPQVSGLPGKIIAGNYTLSTNADSMPGIIVGVGVQNAARITVSEAFEKEIVVLTTSRRNVESADPLASLSEGEAAVDGIFAIQQDFDNSYAVTNLAFLKRQLGFTENEYSAVEIKLKPGAKLAVVKKQLQAKLGNKVKLLSLYEQNSNLYNTIRLEKWAIFAVLTLILIVAAFNIVSALSMLVIEKEKDIAILQSMGTGSRQLVKIFMAEGMLLGLIGAAAGIGLATVICLLQLKFHFVKMYGGSFLIDYFPVKMLATDFLLVCSTIVCITVLSSIVPALKAARQKHSLK